MNKTYSLFKSKAVAIVAMAFVFAANGMAQANDGLTLGNCKNNISTYKAASSKAEKAGAALFYGENTMNAYKGCMIKKVAIGANNQTDGKAVRVFLTKDLNGKAEYEETFDAKKNGWNTFELSQPYEIDGTSLYIGYEISGTRYLAYCNPLVENKEWINRSGTEWKENDGKYSAALYAIVTGDNLPENNVRLGTTAMPKYVVAGTNIKYDGEFQNLGMATVKDLTFRYLVDGKEQGQKTVSGLNVDPREEGQFSLSSLKIDNEGDYDIALEIIKVNGGLDAVAYDNMSDTVKTVCRNGFTKRKSMLEVFSTEPCTQCPAAHAGINKALEGVDDVVELDHHAGFMTDTFTIDESLEYEWFYNPEHIYAPAMMFDRTNFGDTYPDYFNYGVPMIDASGTLATVFRQVATAIPAFVSVNINGSMDAATRQLKLRIGGKKLLDGGNEANMRLFVFLTEDSIYSEKQAGASKGFWHRHVARKSLTPTWGEPVSVSEGYEKNFEATIPTEWNASKMEAVAFVAEYDPEDKNNCKVLNTEKLNIGELLPTGINEVETSPKNGFDVYTIQGIHVGHLDPNGINALPKGIYIVNGKKTVLNGIR